MKALNESEVRRSEELAMAAGWSEGDLLRMAGKQLGNCIGRFFPQPRKGVAYLGKGHNAGDALVTLSVLRDEFDWDVSVRFAFSSEDWAPLLREVWEETEGISSLEESPCHEADASSLVLIDGLAGMGLSGGLRPPLSDLAIEINDLRMQFGATVVAVDLPSGVDADKGTAEGIAVAADVTFQIANPKIGLLREDAVPFTGSLTLVRVPPLFLHADGEVKGSRLISAPSAPVVLPLRSNRAHKGMTGEVTILAGSTEYPGAAILAATAALRSGVGLVRLDVPCEAYDLVISRCPPEIIVRGVHSPADSFAREADSFVVGCGLGQWAAKHRDALIEGLKSTAVPTVVDADALNQLAWNREWMGLGENHVLTPHPGEFDRLAPDLPNQSREEMAEAFVEQFPGVLVLKGGRTIVTSTGSGLWVNGTGNAGMATGGSGDWLAGVIGALLTGVLTPHQSACIAVWLSGRCAELVCWHGGASLESCLPSDFGHWMGPAFRDWRSGCR